MPIIGTSVGQSVAGAHAAERTQSRAVEKRDTTGPRARARKSDELIVGAEIVDATDRVRSLKSNDQEESREDHQQRPPYTRGGTLNPTDDAPRLDLAG